MSLFDIQISDIQSVPVTRDSFRHDIEGLQFSTMRGGGHAECTFVVPSPTRSATIGGFLLGLSSMAASADALQIPEVIGTTLGLRDYVVHYG